MKKYLALLFAALMIVGLFQVSAARPASAQAIGGLSPISGSVLVAEAIHSGALHPGSGAQGVGANPSLSCKPEGHCVLPNVQASSGSSINNEDPIAVNPVNHKELLTGSNDYNCGGLQGFFASGDRGSTWSSTCLGTLSGCSGDGDPGVGYDLAGAAYATGINVCSSASHIVFEKSTNNGGSWSAPAIAVSNLFSGGLTDKDWLQIDDSASSKHAGALYISVTQFDSSSNRAISVSHSDAGGSTWTTVQVDTLQTYPNVDQFSDLAIGASGTVYVTWMRCTADGPKGDCGGTTATLMISSSTDGGTTWSTPVTIASVSLAPDACGCAFYGSLPNTNERVSEIPATDVDRSSGTHSGNLYTVMYTWTGTYMKVEVATSTDGGSTWGKPVAVAPSTDTHDQFFPWLSVSVKGTVGVSWLDRRNDPNNLNYEAFSTQSTTGGTSFKKDVQVASVASNPLNDGFGGGFMGDYTGNYWAADNLYVSWMDTRSGSVCQDEVGGTS